MADKAHKITDKLLQSTEKEIHSIYDEAAKEAQKKVDEFFQKFAAKDAEKKALVDQGKLTKAEYEAWRKGKMLAGTRYTAMADALATDMTNANQIAASVINGHLPDVYATNYNWSTYDIEQKAQINTNFALYDRQTVERLIRDKPDLLPMKAGIDIPADKKWNKQKINGAITQGILLGESIPDISKRLTAVTDMNRTAAVRNARTMTTSAENAGRKDSYKRAQDMGIKIDQEWLASPDSRTRHEHRMLHGQVRKIGEPFEVEGYEIEFPGDPKAEPFLVYNCRCTTVSIFKGFDHKKMDAYVKNTPMTYEQWEKAHKAAEKPKRPDTPEGWLYRTGYSFEKRGLVYPELNGMIENADETAQDVWKKFAPELNYARAPAEGMGKAYYNPGEDRVHFREDRVIVDTTGKPKYNTFFHEYGHNIDYIYQRDEPGYFTDRWKNEEGKSFQEIIMEEWRKKFTPEVDDNKIAIQKFVAQTAPGGMGRAEFVKSEIVEWRRREGLSRYDEAYKALMEEFNGATSSTDLLAFYKKHKDKFITDSERAEAAKPDQAAIKAYIKKTRENYSLEARGDLSDMMEKFSLDTVGLEYPLGMGHGKDYHEDAKNTSREAFAEMFAAEFSNPESLALIKQEMPESYAAFRQIMEAMLA